MDPRIWSRLPEDLLDHVLSSLPLKIFLGLRSTCKHFNSLVFSSSFISKHTSSSPSSSFILLSHPQFRDHFPLYDTTLNTWRKISLSVPPILTCASSAADLLSISHGFLCFSLPYSSSFLVCNLLARSSTTVNFPILPFPFELLTLVFSPNGYKLFTLCSSSSGSSNNAFIYDSGLNLWQQFDGVDSVLADNYHQEGVFYNGYLYFTTPEPFSVVCFDLESGKWERPLVDLPRELTFVRLVTDGGEKLFLIGGIGQNGISRSIKLWELGGNGNGIGGDDEWVEVLRVPAMICRKFLSVCYHNYEHVYCFWHDGLICLCSYNWPEVLYYKVSRRTWHWLPKSPLLPEKWSFGFRWFPLVPQLSAFV